MGAISSFRHRNLRGSAAAESDSATYTGTNRADAVTADINATDICMADQLVKWVFRFSLGFSYLL